MISLWAVHFNERTVMNLVPVPKGMCPAFYQFMAAGGHRSDSGEILMIGPSDTAKSLLREVYRQVDNSAQVPKQEFESRVAYCLFPTG